MEVIHNLKNEYKANKGISREEVWDNKLDLPQEYMYPNKIIDRLKDILQYPFLQYI